MSSLFRKLRRACKEFANQPVGKLDLAKDYVLGFFEDIWFNCTKRPLRRIYIVYKYAKQGWNTNNWDYDYLIDDMRFKLRLMAECIHKNGFLENSKEVAKQILKFRVMLGNLQNLDTFIGSKYDKILEEKYGPRQSLEEMLNNKKVFQLKRKKLIDNPELEEEYNKEFRKYMDMEHKECEEYEKKVMEYFLKHFRGWWD